MIGSNPNVQQSFRKQMVSQRRHNPGFSDTVSSANKQKMVKETSRNLLTILQGRRLMGSVDEQAKTQLIDFLKSCTSASGPNLITLHSRFFTFEKGLITLSKVLTDPQQKKQLSDILFGPDQTKNFFRLTQSTFEPIKKSLNSCSDSSQNTVAKQAIPTDIDPMNRDIPIPVLKQPYLDTTETIIVSASGAIAFLQEPQHHSNGNYQSAIPLLGR